MFWTLLINPLVILLCGAAGFAACRAAGINPHVHEMLQACAICLLASEAALVAPLLNPRPIGALVQATLIGTVLHLGLVAIMGIAGMLALNPGNAFVYWLLAMYWLTLLSTSGIFIRMVRTRPDTTQAPRN